MAKGEPASPPPRPKGAAHPSLLATHWPKEAPLTGPHWPTYRPKASHWPPMATASLTGHLRAPYWPSGEASHWPKGRPRLAKGTGGGAYGHTGAPAPHFPATYGQREPHHPLATDWPPKSDLAKWRLWPPTPPRPTPADRGLRTGGLPTPRLTHWPKWPPRTGHLRPPTGHPGTPPLPRLSGSGGLREGRVFACKGLLGWTGSPERGVLGPLRATSGLVQVASFPPFVQPLRNFPRKKIYITKFLRRLKIGGQTCYLHLTGVRESPGSLLALGLWEVGKGGYMGLCGV